MSVRDVVMAAAGQGAEPLFVESVFSTYLYTGNGSTQTITNGIDLAGEGGLVWVKSRPSVASHCWTDSAQGISKRISSNSSGAAQPNFEFVSWNGNGFSLDAGQGFTNTNAVTYASWTFRKAEKFFDVVTWTGTGSSRTIAHNLGSVPGCIIVKRTDSSANWQVYHRSLNFSGGTAEQSRIVLNTTAAQAEATYGYWDRTAPTSTVFYLGGDDTVNASGGTYVAYIFAHNAGGFGLTGSDNVISCGSYVGNGGTTTPNQISIGFEPQWLLIKASSTTSNWAMGDVMRGMYTESGGTAKYRELLANTTGSEGGSDGPAPTSTGFAVSNTGLPNASGVTYIYVAIRRGPMKTPESGTEVFVPNYGSDVTTYTTNFPLDSGWDTQLPIGGSTSGTYIAARLVGSMSLVTSGGAGETTSAPPSDFWQSNTSYRWNTFGNECSTYAFRRAPSFFDVVCYTGNATLGRTVAHNLTIAPELMIVRQRTGGDWYVYSSGTGATKFLELNASGVAVTESSVWNNTAPTSSVFTLGDATGVNRNNTAFIAYLFATCPGVSKVFSYTGNGSSQTINCGFTSGARFILIKRTDSSGDWYVWDSARGIVAGNDPYYRLNSTISEVTTNDSVDTASTGFIVNQVAATNVNVSSATYIGLAIA